LPDRGNTLPTHLDFTLKVGAQKPIFDWIASWLSAANRTRAMDALDRFAAIVPFERRNNDMRSRENSFFFSQKKLPLTSKQRASIPLPPARNGTRRHFFSSVVGRWWNVHQRLLVIRMISFGRNWPRLACGSVCVLAVSSLQVHR